MTINYVESSKLPTPWGMFAMHGFEDTKSAKEHLVLSMGDITDGAPLLVRVHSECLTGDALFSLRCDCGAQLQHALHRIAMEGRGAIFYLRQEGRGIGLLNKIRAYHLQDCGADTVEANEQLGFGADMRDYSILKPMIDHWHIDAIRLMTNNPRKLKAIQDLGVNVVERLSHQTGRNPHNAKYLSTKKGKLGHLLQEDNNTIDDAT
ncbi:MAG: GTP cyclohydrolase II [Gammaproteobacteria bacterium]|nr:GTP cyclohydrolase II [Gammaproteobacteria bacterium]